MKTTKAKRVLVVVLLLALIVSSIPLFTLQANAVNRRSLSQGQRNIVKRAKQMTDIKWTPKANIGSWNWGTTFYAGQTYSGLPYGQPVSAGQYVPWSAGLETFANSVKNAGSVMYTQRGAFYNYGRQNTFPFYSTDCSAFVSRALNMGSRKTTYTITQNCTLVSTNSYANIQDGFGVGAYHGFDETLAIDGFSGQVRVDIYAIGIDSNGNVNNKNTHFTKVYERENRAEAGESA